MTKVVLVAAVAAIVALPVMALNGVESGLAKGESVTPFHPDHINGPLKGTDKCFPCTFGKRPAIQVWVNNDDMKNVAKIAESLQANIDSHKAQEFKAMIVVLTNDKAATKMQIGKALDLGKVKDVAISLIAPNHEAIKAYKINTDSSVKNTFLLYRDWTVANKFVNVKLDDKACGEMCEAISGLVK
ncbi:MAG: hypothetical protein JST30_07930 [Armatimonadetes bacterium]|nr:hypothetical protein [Armatimonadota bacterium]